jgi:hypothetical protein
VECRAVRIPCFAPTQDQDSRCCKGILSRKQIGPLTDWFWLTSWSPLSVFSWFPPVERCYHCYWYKCFYLVEILCFCIAFLPVLMIIVTDRPCMRLSHWLPSPNGEGGAARKRRWGLSPTWSVCCGGLGYGSGRVFGWAKPTLYLLTPDHVVGECHNCFKIELGMSRLITMNAQANFRAIKKITERFADRPDCLYE